MFHYYPANQYAPTRMVKTQVFAKVILYLFYYKLFYCIICIQFIVSHVACAQSTISASLFTTAMGSELVPAVSFIITRNLGKYEQMYKRHKKVHVLSFNLLELLPELTRSLPSGQFVPFVLSNGRFHMCLEGPEGPPSKSTNCEFRPWSGLLCPRDDKTTVFIFEDPDVEQDNIALCD